MKIEMRVRNLSELEDIPKELYTHIGLGDEGCTKWLPTEKQLQEFSAFCKENDKKLTLVTPKAPQNVYNRVVSTAKLAREIDPSIELVINDNGVLYELSQTMENLTVGRMVVFTTETCPWHEIVLEEEPDSIKEQGTFLNLREEQKVELYKRLGVSSVEANYLPKLSKTSFPFFKDNGWSVSAHFGYGNIALTRSCHLTRHNDGKCDKQCQTWQTLNLDQVYNIDYENMNPLSKEGSYFKLFPAIEAIESHKFFTKEHFEFTLAGTVILRKEKSMSPSDATLNSLDKVIFNPLGFGKDELIYLLKETQNQNSIVKEVVYES